MRHARKRPTAHRASVSLLLRVQGRLRGSQRFVEGFGLAACKPPEVSDRFTAAELVRPAPAQTADRTGFQRDADAFQNNFSDHQNACSRALIRCESDDNRFAVPSCALRKCSTGRRMFGESAMPRDQGLQPLATILAEPPYTLFRRLVVTTPT